MFEHSGHLLVVEDGRALLDPETPELSAGGWQVETVHGAPAALERLETQFYDAVLTDLETTGTNCEWLRRLRLLQPRTALIVAAAPEARETLVCALREGAYGVCGRPIQPAVLLDMIDLARQDGEWRDDIELLSGSADWITVMLRCKLPALDRYVQFVRELLAGVPTEVREDLAAALREMLLNAVEHGGHSDPRQRVRVSCVRGAGALICHVQDPGTGFSLHTLPHAAIANPPDQPVQHANVRAEHGFRPGGFGILLTRSLVDELIYNEKGNEVVLVKYLGTNR